jgi:hypothetical protein
MKRKSFWQIVKDNFAKQDVFVKCGDSSCTNNKKGYCTKCYPKEIEINSERKCMSFDFE